MTSHKPTSVRFLGWFIRTAAVVPDTSQDHAIVAVSPKEFLEGSILY